MSTVRPIEIFRPGRHTAMSGETLVFGEADLRASAEAYDPSRHEAPIVIGHPRHDAPAYGWIASLSYADGRLLAHPRQVDPEFAELVRNGRFKKVSASFYKPDSPSNPVPGVYCLRHVGCLGAQPPAVKGLKAVELAAGDEDVVEVEFGEADGGIVRDLFRRLREWLIRSAGPETADDVVPAWMVDSVERQLEEAKDSPSYAEPTGSVSQQREETDVDPKELEKRERELAERQRELEAREAEFAEREQQIQAAAREARRQAIAAQVDDLVEQGRVLPRDREPLVALFAELGDQVLEFGEDGRQTQTPAADWLREFLGRLPPQVDYGERSGAEAQTKSDTAVPVPPGYQIRQDRLELHRRALAYAEQHEVDYLTAVRAVERS